MRLVTALLVRNEAGPDRFLRRVLTRCLAFSDTVVLLDDRSTDDTATIAHDMGCVVETRSGDLAWGKEAQARKELWALACRYAIGPNDWILVCDADMILRGDPRPLMKTKETNAWSWRLYDLWSQTEYREDDLWVGHLHPRVWMVAPHRVPTGWTADWTERGVHCGHLPTNYPIILPFVAPDDVYWEHWSYATPQLRAQKYEQYKTTWDLMSPQERRHAESIIQ